MSNDPQRSAKTTGSADGPTPRPPRAPTTRPRPAVVHRATPGSSSSGSSRWSPSSWSAGSCSSRRPARPMPARPSSTRPRPRRRWPTARRARSARSSRTWGATTSPTGDRPALLVLPARLGQPLRRHRRARSCRATTPRTTPTVPQGWIHNLEHGGLVILYSCDEGRLRRRDASRPSRRSSRPSRRARCARSRRGRSARSITRFDDMKAPIAALLWGRVLFQDKLDTAQILEYFKTQAELKNPEQQCARPSPGASAGPAASSSAAPAASPSAAPSVLAGRQPGAVAQPVLTRSETRCACTPIATGPDGHRWGVLVDGRRCSPGASCERVGGLSGPGTRLESSSSTVRRSDRGRPGRDAPPSAPARRAHGRGRLGRRAPAAAIPFPGKIVCIGLNYRDHALEGGRDAPDRPMLFAKFANAVIADGEPIVRPPGCHALDLEAELGVVIGRTASHVAAKDAMRHVAGYVVRQRRRAPATSRAASRPCARASTATASGSGRRARTRSSRSARSS